MPKFSAPLSAYRFFVLLSLVSLVSACIISSFIGGCGRETQGTTVRGEQSTLSIPPKDFVRLVSRQIQDTPIVGETGDKTQSAPEMLHYKWSVIGERNWQNPKADKGGFVLGDVYPLNDTRKRGGCNIWECDLSAQATGNAVAWHLIVHGSNGQTAIADGTTPGVDIKTALRVVQTRDEAVALPADVLLAKIGEQEVRLKVAQ